MFVDAQDQYLRFALQHQTQAHVQCYVKHNLRQRNADDDAAVLHCDGAEVKAHASM